MIYDLGVASVSSGYNLRVMCIGGGGGGGGVSGG